MSQLVADGLLSTLNSMGKGKHNGGPGKNNSKSPSVYKPSYAPGWTDVHYDLGRSGIPYPDHNFQEYEGTVETFLQNHMPQLISALKNMLEEKIRHKWADQNGPQK